MNITLRMMQRLAAAASFAAALWIVSPATAAEGDVSARQPVGIGTTKTASAPVKRHQHWPRYHLASWYTSHVHVADAGTPLRHCYWFCGRPFVLMVGVAY
jgi:hypothetical protein